MMEPFYVHSIEYWGAPNRWAVFRRLDRGWRQASKAFKTRGPAERMRDRMNADWKRYQFALWDSRYARKSADAALCDAHG
jgi:hypothetical protein